MKFIVLGQQSAITYKDVFPLLRDRRVRLGAGPRGQIAWFESPYEDVAAASGHKPGMIRVSGVRWFTNLRHDVRRRLPPLKTMAENLATNKRLRKHLLEKYGRLEYPRYDNYAAIEVPFVDAIPSDYDGVMGVPVTFLDKWDPDGGAYDVLGHEHGLPGGGSVPEFSAGGRCVYSRLLVQPRHEIVGITLGNTIEPGPERIYSGAVQHNADGSVQPGGKVNTRAAVRVDGPPDGCWYSAGGVDGALLSVYPRLLIRPTGA